MLQIASIGECMVELAASSPTTYQRGYAGDTFNAAVYCARALTTFNNPSIVIEYVTALGDQDAFSQGIETLCHAEHLGTTLIRHLPGRLPGLYLIETDPTGERH